MHTLLTIYPDLGAVAAAILATSFLAVFFSFEYPEARRKINKTRFASFSVLVIVVSAIITIAVIQDFLAFVRVVGIEASLAILTYFLLLGLAGQKRYGAMTRVMLRLFGHSDTEANRGG